MKKFTRILFFLICISPYSQAIAQQTVFNVPSADTAPKNKTFLQHESQFRAKDPEKYLNTTNYFARGITDNTEIDATLFNLGSPASKNVSLGLGFKNATKLADNAFKPKFTFGSMIPFSLQGNGAGNWTYATLSAVAPISQTRITGGASYGTKQIFGQETICAIGAIEQQINENFSLLTDWYSGNHSMGILVFGFSHNLPQDFSFYGGYQIPNSKRIGRNGFLIEIAKIF